MNYMVTDAKVANPTDSLSMKDETSAGVTPKPSGVADKVSTPDEQSVESQKAMDAYADKKHSKLDKMIHTLTTERDGMKKQFSELSAKYEELSQSSYEKQKQEALEEAKQYGDPEKLKVVQSHFQTIEDDKIKKAENARLDTVIESKKDLIDRLHAKGTQEKAEELEESTGVPSELILKLFTEQGLTDIEEMEKLAETLKDYVPKKGKETVRLPHPDRVQGSVSGELTEEQRLQARYPKMYNK